MNVILVAILEQSQFVHFYDTKYSENFSLGCEGHITILFNERGFIGLHDALENVDERNK